ncbi:MAG: phage tail protein [Firmicutes bacterium]|nr:phage tail protein [Bacillota bacterium]
MATRPTITITFKQLATTLIKRSERGTAIMLLTDTTGTEEEVLKITTKVYKTVADIDTSLYTADNLALIKNCLNYAPYELVVISGNSSTFADFAKYITQIRKTGWVAFVGNAAAQSDLASWIKSMENASSTFKGVGTISGKDCKQYVYFNQNGVDTEGNTVTAVNYLASLLGILASCNIRRGCTNFHCTDLSEIGEVDNVDTAISAGQLVMANETDGVRIVAGINSLVTLNGNTATEDMQYIETVEAMNLIADDIREEFKNTYQGSFKNKYMNQMLFIGAVNEYFDSLAGEDVLDSEFDNKAEIDVEAQRSAWMGTGKSEAEDWDEDKVKKMSFKRSVFIAGNIKVLNCMENLRFTVTME